MVSLLEISNFSFAFYLIYLVNRFVILYCDLSCFLKLLSDFIFIYQILIKSLFLRDLLSVKNSDVVGPPIRRQKIIIPNTYSLLCISK